MSVSLLYMPVKFQIEIAKDDKKFDFSLGGYFFDSPCTYMKFIFGCTFNLYPIKYYFTEEASTEYYLILNDLNATIFV